MRKNVRDAILAAEDKNFFSHNGVDYSTIPRVMDKVRVGTVLKRMVRVGREDKADSLVMFRQGGSTITQQIGVSKRIREEFNNGVEYYAMHGKRINLPTLEQFRPSTEYLSWHNENVFRP